MIRITGMNSGMDTDSMVQELVKAYKKKGEKNVQQKTKAEWKQDIWKDLNKKIKAFNSKVRSMQYVSNYNLKKTTVSDESKASVIAGENAVKGTQTLRVDKLAKTAYVTSKKLVGKDNAKITEDSTLADLGITSENSKIYFKQGSKTVEIDANKDTKISTFVAKLQSSGVDASFDEANGRIFISAKESGEDSDFSFEVEGKDAKTDAEKADNLKAINALGLTTASGATVIAGQNARIYLNGAEFESNNNSFNINGMAISVKGETGDEEITLTTDTDIDGIYKNIKDMVKEYSNLINERSKLYNAERAKGFEPLSDEEKEALSDDEVEKWETKIKDSLLRRDSNLATIMNTMRNASIKSYEFTNPDKTKYEMSLADFGIGTMGYFDSEDNEKSALHIDGDEDDDDFASKTNKLKQMLTSDPDKVAKFFASYMTEIADSFNELTKSSADRSYGNFYDDKKAKTELTQYETKVSDWEKYVNDIEDKYYRQFSKMETQLAKLNSTQTSLSNYFGGGQ